MAEEKGLSIDYATFEEAKKQSLVSVDTSGHGLCMVHSNILETFLSNSDFQSETFFHR